MLLFFVIFVVRFDCVVGVVDANVVADVVDVVVVVVVVVSVAAVVV